jgi:hypothetical protein
MKMKTKIVVRKGDKGGGGGDFEIQVFSTASNLPNDLGTEPRLRTLDRHEKRTNLSLKLVKKRGKFYARNGGTRGFPSLQDSGILSIL